MPVLQKQQSIFPHALLCRQDRDPEQAGKVLIDRAYEEIGVKDKHSPVPPGTPAGHINPLS